MHVTFDWTRAVLSATVPDRELTEADRARFAFVDLDGVYRAEWFWMLIPASPSVGSWCELGAALSDRKMVVVSGDWRRSIFTALAHHRFDTHEQAARFLGCAPEAPMLSAELVADMIRDGLAGDKP